MIAGVLLLLLSAEPGRADDLQRQVQMQRASVNDFTALDARGAARSEIQLLREWVDEADYYHTQGQPARVRETIERCLAQGDLIRQVINAANLKRDADSKEKQAKQMRDKVARTRQALKQAQDQKRSLEGKVK